MATGNSAAPCKSPSAFAGGVSTCGSSIRSSPLCGVQRGTCRQLRTNRQIPGHPSGCGEYVYVKIKGRVDPKGSSVIPYYRRNLYVLPSPRFSPGSAEPGHSVSPFILKRIRDHSRDVTFWSGLVFSMHFASALIMMPIWGRMSDRFGRKPMAVRAGVPCLDLLPHEHSASPWQLAVCRFLNGAATGFIRCRPAPRFQLADNTPGAIWRASRRP